MKKDRSVLIVKMPYLCTICHSRLSARSHTFTRFTNIYSLQTFAIFSIEILGTCFTISSCGVMLAVRTHSPTSSVPRGWIWVQGFVVVTPFSMFIAFTLDTWVWISLVSMAKWFVIVHGLAAITLNENLKKEHFMMGSIFLCQKLENSLLWTSIKQPSCVKSTVGLLLKY